MFDEFTQHKKSHFALTIGITAPLLMAGLFFALTFTISGLAINGYDSFPVIDWVEMHDRHLEKLVNRLFDFGYRTCFSIGVSQLIYVVPAFLWARTKGWSDVTNGLLIGASLVLLLNTTCASYLYLELWRK